MARSQRTGVARRRVAELVAVVEGLAHANDTTWWIILPAHEGQLYLELVRVRVAGVCGLEEGSGIGTPGHEELGGVVDLGPLREDVSYAEVQPLAKGKAS